MASKAEDDAMDTSPAKNDMGPPAAVASSNGSSANSSTANNDKASSSSPKDSQQRKEEDTQTGTSQQSAAGAGAAAAASNQPKVVQTAFIHKLYNMLEDQSIQHLISWSSSNESFLISPSSEFSKVLASYFKHTNISSFVRQLNMYGFHKVSDVFQTGSPDSPLWEFKHGNGSFKRGDLAGLRDIKRRASRHTLIHRDSFSNAPKSVAAPQVVASEAMPESLDQRMGMLEQSLYDIHTRLIRSEEAHSVTAARCQILTDNLTKAYQFSHDLSGLVQRLVQDPDHHAHRASSTLQQDISSTLAQLRNEPLLSSYPATGTESGQLSPRQLAQDDPRRGSLREAPRPGLLRPLAPSPNHYPAPPPPLPPTNISPSNSRAYLPQIQSGQPGQPYALPSAALSHSYLSRRHTSADIRNDGWQPGQHHPSTSHLNPPNTSGALSSHYPSSPSRGIPHQPALGHGEQRIRESLANYQMGSNGPARRGTVSFQIQHDSRPSTPPSQGPTQLANGAPGSESAWAAMPGTRIPFKDSFKSSGVSGEQTQSNPASSPATRRSSLANIYTILNPTDNSERNGEDQDTGPGSEDWRKRKRLI